MIPVMLLSLAAGLGPFLDPGSYSSEVFDKFRAIAPIEAWGVGFLIVTALSTWALVRGSLLPYFAANVILLFLSSFWLLSLVYYRAFDGVPISTTAYGLWLYPASSCVIALTIPITVFHQPKIEQLRLPYE
jgi:hypothetical protein